MKFCSCSTGLGNLITIHLPLPLPKHTPPKYAILVQGGHYLPLLANHAHPPSHVRRGEGPYVIQPYYVPVPNHMYGVVKGPMSHSPTLCSPALAFLARSKALCHTALLCPSCIHIRKSQAFFSEALVRIFLKVGWEIFHRTGSIIKKTTMQSYFL